MALRLRCPLTLVLSNALLKQFPTDPSQAQGLLLNPRFLDPFTGNDETGWATTDWNRDTASHTAYLQAQNGGNGNYLYQHVSGQVVGASYRVLLEVLSPPDGSLVSGKLTVRLSSSAGTPTVVAQAAGSYHFDYTASVTAEYLTLGANNQAANLAVSRVDIVRL